MYSIHINRRDLNKPGRVHIKLLYRLTAEADELQSFVGKKGEQAMVVARDRQSNAPKHDMKHTTAIRPSHHDIG